MKGRLAVNCIFVFALLLGLPAAAARSFLRPKEINYYENRYAVQYPAFSAAGALDGSFQDQTEEALADQLPGAQRMKETVHTGRSRMEQAMLTPLLPAMLLSSSFNPFIYFRF